jgi:NADPH:quinone reductase-like Zn-dependent oxidoreductase
LGLLRYDLVQPKHVSRTLLLNDFLKFLGDGFNGISIVDGDIPKPGDGELLVRMLLSPVNPTDVHTVGGKRPIGPHKVPFVAGNEVR